MLRRSSHPIIFGVCGGLSETLGIGAWIIRLALIIALALTGFFPIGLIYVLFAIAMR